MMGLPPPDTGGCKPKLFKTLVPCQAVRFFQAEANDSQEFSFLSEPCF